MMIRESFEMAKSVIVNASGAAYRLDVDYVCSRCRWWRVRDWDYLRGYVSALFFEEVVDSESTQLALLLLRPGLLWDACSVWLEPLSLQNKKLSEIPRWVAQQRARWFGKQMNLKL